MGLDAISEYLDILRVYDTLRKVLDGGNENHYNNVYHRKHCIAR